MSITTENLSAG